MKSYCKLTPELQSLKPSSQAPKRRSVSCNSRTKEHQFIGMTYMIYWILNQNPPLADQARKGRRARPSPHISIMGASSLMRLVHQYQLMSRCWQCWHHCKQWGHRPHCCQDTCPHQGPLGKGDPPILVTGMIPRPLGKT